MRANLAIIGGLVSLTIWAAGVSMAQPSVKPSAPSTAPAPVIISSHPPAPMPATPSTPIIINQPARPTPVPATVQIITPANDNPTGRQEPAVSIEWVGPSTAKIGQPVSYQLIVKNISMGAVQDVVVQGRIPTGATVVASEPKAESANNSLTWKIGTLEPRQDKRIDLQIIANSTGVLAPSATVTLSGTSSTRLHVYEPKLVVKTAAPDKVIIGDPAPITISVANPGDATAEFVKVTAVLTDGLEHAKGKTVEFDLGNLAPRETRCVQVLCSAKAGGTQQCEAHAVGQPKLTSDDIASIDVLVPKVELTVSGPGMRYLDRHATVTFKVTNPGTATANHVNLVDQVPQGFTFVSATSEGRHDFVTRTVAWFLDDIGPGQSREVTMELAAANTGDHKNKAVVTAARGLKAESEIATRVEGLPALLMELVDLDDPVEVGAETSYEIRVTNTGTKTETNLQLTCTVPDKMDFRGAKAPQGINFKQDGKEIVFDAIPKLAPRADVIYRVNVRGTAPGDLRFRARIKADGLVDPVLKEESTKVYGDDGK
jgi:uncharacterized repeat protein (TIGR01451 family)